MSEKDTGTPRTDTFYDSRLSDMKSEKDHETSSAWYSFARTLERKLANVKAQLAAAEAKAKRYEYVMNMSYLEMVSLYTFPLGDRVAEIDRRMILEATRNMESGKVKIKAESRAEKADAKVRELFGTECTRL